MFWAIFKGLLITIEVLTSILLVVTILIQRTKNQGMGLAFGAGVGETMFGSQAGNVLTRATVVLAVVFLANTTVLALVGIDREERSVVERVGAPAPSPMPVMPPPMAPSAPGPMSLAPDGGGFGGVPMEMQSAPVQEGWPVEAVQDQGTAVGEMPDALPANP